MDIWIIDIYWYHIHKDSEELDGGYWWILGIDWYWRWSLFGLEIIVDIFFQRETKIIIRGSSLENGERLLGRLITRKRPRKEALRNTLPQRNGKSYEKIVKYSPDGALFCISKIFDQGTSAFRCLSIDHESLLTTMDVLYSDVLNVWLCGNLWNL